MDNFEKFLNDFLDGNLEAYLKSEAVPDNSDNAVKVRGTYFSRLGLGVWWLPYRL